MPEQQYNNFGEALMKGLSGGLSNLAGFLQTERENRMEKMLFLMKQQAFEADAQQSKVDLQMSQLKLQQATADSFKSLKDKKTEEAQAEMQAKMSAATLPIGAAMQGTPMGNILNAIGQPASSLPFESIFPIAQQQGVLQNIDLEKLGIGMQNLPSPIPDFSGLAQKHGLVPTGINQDGSINYGRPYQDSTADGKLTEGARTDMVKAFLRKEVKDKQGKRQITNKITQAKTPEELQAVVDSAASLGMIGNFSLVPPTVPQVPLGMGDLRATGGREIRRQKAIESADSIFPDWRKMSPRDQESYLQFLENRK